MNTMLVGTGVVLAAAALSAIGFLLVSRFIPARWLVADADAASALYATIGMVYAILIAIAAIAIWEPRTNASQNADQEATTLVEAYWSARRLPAADRTDVQHLIVGYLHEVTDREWPSLRDTRSGTATADVLFTRLRDRVDAVAPATDQELAAQQQLAGQVSEAATARRARLAAAPKGMPSPLWPILIAGGLVSIMFLYLFGLDRTFPNGLMMAAVGGMIALLLFVIYQVEFPYSRGFAVDPGSFRTAISEVQSS